MCRRPPYRGLQSYGEFEYSSSDEESLSEDSSSSSGSDSEASGRTSKDSESSLLQITKHPSHGSRSRSSSKKSKSKMRSIGKAGSRVDSRAQLKASDACSTTSSNGGSGSKHASDGASGSVQHELDAQGDDSVARQAAKAARKEMKKAAERASAVLEVSQELKTASHTRSQSESLPEPPAPTGHGTLVKAALLEKGKAQGKALDSMTVSTDASATIKTASTRRPFIFLPPRNLPGDWIECWDPQEPEQLLPNSRVLCCLGGVTDHERAYGVALKEVATRIWQVRLDDQVNTPNRIKSNQINFKSSRSLFLFLFYPLS
jgi:hypothetical protein